MPDLYKNAGITVARMAGRDAAMDVYAHEFAGMVRLAAARHIKTGHYEASIGVAHTPGESGVIDRAVYSNDPQAHIIEWGHWDKDHHHWTPGQYIFQQAYAALPKGHT